MTRPLFLTLILGATSGAALGPTPAAQINFSNGKVAYSSSERVIRTSSGAVVDTSTVKGGFPLGDGITLTCIGESHAEKRSGILKSPQMSLSVTCDPLSVAPAAPQTGSTQINAKVAVGTDPQDKGAYPLHLKSAKTTCPRTQLQGAAVYGHAGGWGWGVGEDIYGYQGENWSVGLGGVPSNGPLGSPGIGVHVEVTSKRRDLSGGISIVGTEGSGCTDTTFDLEGYGSIEFTCSNSFGKSSVFVGGRIYDYDGHNWLLCEAPPQAVLDALRAHGITAFPSQAHLPMSCFGCEG